MSSPLLDIGNRNLIINGGGHFWQRWTTTNNTLATPAFMISDRFAMFGSGTTAKNCTVSQQTSLPSEIVGRAQFSMQVTSTSNFTPTGNDRWTPYLYQVEGYDYGVWHNGKNMALTFYMQAPVAGDYSIYITNIDGSRKQIRTVNIAAGEVNTWVRRSILFTTDTAGVWNLTNLTSFEIGFFTVGSGTTIGSASNSWQSGNPATTTSTCVNWAATNGNSIRLAGVQLHGYTGKYYQKDFQVRGEDWQRELMLCQRYYEKSYGIFTNPGTSTTIGARLSRQSGADTHFYEPFKVQKRISPTISIYSTTGAINFARQLDGAGSPVDRAASGSANDHAIGDINIVGAPDQTTLGWHWVANADIA